MSTDRGQRLSDKCQQAENNVKQTHANSHRKKLNRHMSTGQQAEDSLYQTQQQAFVTETAVPLRRTCTTGTTYHVQEEESK